MYNNKNVKELKAIARSRKIKGYYKMRKAELIETLKSSVGLGLPLFYKTKPQVNLLFKRKPPLVLFFKIQHHSKGAAIP